jgi:hypothetical protein
LGKISEEHTFHNLAEKVGSGEDEIKLLMALTIQNITTED